jgi:hypothetical protein
MITTRTAALIAGMALLGTVAPAAFAQNTSVNQDNDYVKQLNKIDQDQKAANFASAGTGGGGSGDDVIAGNNAAAVSFQDQDATATNTNSDDDTFDTTQVDVCALVFVAIIC